jgi:hypothetical protein
MRLNFADAQLSVSPILALTTFDVGIYAIGYEQRSRHIAETMKVSTARLIGIDLGGDTSSLNVSRHMAKNRGDDVLRSSDIGLSETSVGALDLNIPDGGKVFVDLSSMDRRTMSLVIYHVLRASEGKSIDMDFLYAPAQYSDPPEDMLPIQSSEPVNALLAGNLRDPRLPTILFLGLGYEVGLALGVVEFFEPARVLAFTPRGTDPRYDAMVDKVNYTLLSDQDYISRIEYSVMSPTNTLIGLKERMLALREIARIVFVPLGPKIFSSMAILLGYLYAPDITVWRVSTRINPKDADRVADGSIIGYKLQIRRANDHSLVQ